NTDDRNVIEFAVARSVGRNLLLIADIDAAARASATARPPVDDERAVAWQKVGTAYISYGSSLSDFSDTRTGAPADEQARQAALVQYYQHGNLSAARELWHGQSDEARDLNELVMVADLAIAA